MNDKNKNTDEYEDELTDEEADSPDIDGDLPTALADSLEDEGQLDFGLDDDNQDDSGEEINKESKDNQDEIITISKPKMALIKKLLENIKENNDRLIQMLAVFISDEEVERIGIGQINDDDIDGGEEDISGKSGKIIEGVFDGESMIGPDGKQYSVPVNYASKSKLVEGDILKLTITDNGTFVYKQIGPIDRIREVGKLEKNSEGNFIVRSDNKKWRILAASVTYFKGSVGDEAVVLIPKTGESKWAAVENIIRGKE